MVSLQDIFTDGISAPVVLLGRPEARVLLGDTRDALKALPDALAQVCVTSPPFWQLRDYGIEGQIGLEPHYNCFRHDPTVMEFRPDLDAGDMRSVIAALPALRADSIPPEILAYFAPQQPCGECYVCVIASVFEEVYRVLAPDGVLFLNLGDTIQGDSPVRSFGRERYSKTWDQQQTRSRGGKRRTTKVPGPYRLKDYLDIPSQVREVLIRRGWRRGQEIIWRKSTYAPRGRMTDRFDQAHEKLFLFSKQRHYYFNREALPPHFRNSVWNIPPSHGSRVQTAPFPEALAEPCILAGSREGQIVLDPFLGDGTTLKVAQRLGRLGVGADLSPRTAHSTSETLTQPYCRQSEFLTPAQTGSHMQLCPACHGSGELAA